jgi:hypothetical protein
MDDLIVPAIRRQLQSKTTDIGKASQSRLYRADPVKIADDEERLGFPFPPLLKRIYIEIGNGGFGPGYGLIGLTGGVPDDTGSTAPETYNQFRGGDRSDPTWRWPHGLLPICHWGCAILSCIDCTDPNFRMRIFDPNLRQGNWVDDCFFEESDGFGIWIRAWAYGTDLWDAMYGTDGHIARILSARRSNG